MKREIKYDIKLLIKLSLIFFGLLFMLCILLGRRERKQEPPEGDKITVQDVEILLEALDINMSEVTQQEDTPNLTYGMYVAIRQALQDKVPDLPEYEKRYEPEHEMLKTDWYAAYRIMLAYLDTESSIWETDIFLLKTDTAAKEAYIVNGNNRTPYHYLSDEFEKNQLREMKVYVKGNDLLAVSEVVPGEYELKNVWVTEAAEGTMECFFQQTYFTVMADQVVKREQIADLVVRDGRVVKAREKSEKVHGKLLWVSKDALEIEGSGVYPLSEGIEVYKLYGSMETLACADLRIGYADTDYVIERGKVCACLVSERETADRIRVLLKNTAKGTSYYDRVELIVDGETIQIEEKDLAVGERRSYRCAALTDKILLNIEGISKEDNAYRGVVECYRNEEGMVLINELPLEEYLYAVVPSEMPASYPAESLKAQAVCARTYAYRYILRAGLPEVGAHVDDTTAYQVYHNCRENVATTTAVKETDGVLLTYQDEPAQNYYYSTSCGIGTDAAIWKSGSEEDISYLRAVEINRDTYAALGSEEEESAQDQETVRDSEAADNLKDEENFRQFITTTNEADLEYTQPWYRWIYTVEEIDEEAMLSRIRDRYAVSPASVLTKTEGEYYVSQTVEKLGKIKELSIAKRGAGGVAEELLIVTDQGTYKILSEYNIRYILCDTKSEIVKQDGSVTIPSTLLPSGFFIIEAGKKEGNMIGYTLIGGGYGHGVGMSQNGAKALGEEGSSYSQILEFFFPGCELTDSDRTADL
ncbi:MAG: SpoIID/LytB domain-containing protein [Lachnospiraceae bacterium]|nr:SpoIID/LytB domain-containing protein [Lachnospiraceae bacterium]